MKKDTMNHVESSSVITTKFPLEDAEKGIRSSLDALECEGARYTPDKIPKGARSEARRYL